MLETHLEKHPPTDLPRAHRLPVALTETSTAKIPQDNEVSSTLGCSGPRKLATKSFPPYYSQLIVRPRPALEVAVTASPHYTTEICITGATRRYQD